VLAAIGRLSDPGRARHRNKMIVYHTTTAEAADRIIQSGFRDSTGTYMTDHLWTGVWVSDRPLGTNEGAKGNFLLQIDLRVSEEDIAQYEWVQEDSTYREWLIPAGLLNSGAITFCDKKMPQWRW
jgi:hypothetical protein